MTCWFHQYKYDPNHHRVGISDGRGSSGIDPAGAFFERAMGMLPTSQTWLPLVRVLVIARNTGVIASGWFIAAITRSMRCTSCESIGGTLIH